MRKCTEAKNFDEVPLRSYKDTEKNMRCGSGMFLQGCSGFSTLADSRKQEKMSQQRARTAIAELEEAGTDCSLVCHRFFMMVLCHELKKAGYKIEKSRRINIKNLDVIEAIK